MVMGNDLDQPTYYSNSSDSDARYSRDVERSHGPHQAVACCSIASHEALKLNDALWASLELNGVQEDYDDEGNRADLELRTHSCGSTLARKAVRS